MAIYTRQGDRLETSLLGGRRAFKDDLRIAVLGEIDELGTVLGLARCELEGPAAALLEAIQGRLQQAAARLADPGGAGSEDGKPDADDVRQMEAHIDDLTAAMPPFRGFVLPGPPRGAALLHLARTVARRAERHLVRLARREGVDAVLLQYFNRLSDLLFVMAEHEKYRALIQRLTRAAMLHLAVRQGTGTESEGGLAMRLSAAKEIIAAAEARAGELGVPMVIAVVDGAGHLVALHRMDGALLASIDIAINKAFTACAVRMPTQELGALAQPGQPLYGIEVTNRGRMVIFGGGLPLYEGARVCGGIGVSGGTVEQDVAVARAGVEAWERIRAG